ncbi:hypothetical protein Tco_1570225 [Tanacetum coccineum]
MRTRSSLEYTIPRRSNRSTFSTNNKRQFHIVIVSDSFKMAMTDYGPEQLQAPTGGFESAIVVPPINAQNFELKSSLINLVQNRIFRGEIFLEAWERFQGIFKKCLINGFRSCIQIDTFYIVSYNDQDSLNSAAGGNFLYKSPTEGLQIIENKAKVRCSRNAVMRVSTNAPPSSSTSSSSNFEFQQMAAALEDKMTLTF